jgi:hypothetical protein
MRFPAHGFWLRRFLKTRLFFKPEPDNAWTEWT